MTNMKTTTLKNQWLLITPVASPEYILAWNIWFKTAHFVLMDNMITMKSEEQIIFEDGHVISQIKVHNEDS